MAEWEPKWDKLTDDKHAPSLRAACEMDLYFLLRYICKREDLAHQWILDRCDEVQSSPNGFLDLWARDHYKSSIITFGKTLQDILSDPEITIGIFSHTRPAAKAFLRQIKREVESNQLLKDLFPDILWRDPSKDSPGWSEDNGLVFKRKGNPKEATLEAWGLVDGQPTGRHFKLRVYDDVVSQEAASSEEMRRQTLSSWELSLNLGTRDGAERYIGTRYHFADVYATMIDRQAAKERRWPAIDPEGKPYLLTSAQLADKRNKMGSITFSAQMLLDPLAASTVYFRREDLRFYKDVRAQEGNTYLIVDPANQKKKKSDYTAIFVVTLSPDKNIYVRDVVRDRINLAERCRVVMGLHRFWRPRKVLYEEYGMMSDVQSLKMEQDREGYRFEVQTVGGMMGKPERIAKLVPLFEQHRIYLPDRLERHSDELGRPVDMVKAFVDEEFATYPFSAHDDMLDCLARVEDPKAGLVWPKESQAGYLESLFGARGPKVAAGTAEVEFA
jgi:predicted phage terminase large subunit-like protein